MASCNILVEGKNENRQGNLVVVGKGQQGDPPKKRDEKEKKETGRKAIVA